MGRVAKMAAHYISAAGEGYSLIKQLVVLALIGLASPTALAETDAEKELREVRERIQELQRSARRAADRSRRPVVTASHRRRKVQDARGRLGDVRRRLPPATRSQELGRSGA